MIKANGKSRLTFLAASVLFAFVGGASFAKSDPLAVKEEAGFYYGYGKGSTKDEAQLQGKRDLVETALTYSLRAQNPKASRVNVSEDSVNARIQKLNPYVQDKAGTNVVYRIKIQDWEKDEKSFEETLRKSLLPKYENFIGMKDISGKLNAGVEILNILSSNGETEFLTVQTSGTELFARKVEAACSDAVKNLALSLSAADGIVGKSTSFSVSASDSKGSPVSGLNLKASWEIQPFFGSTEIPAGVVSTVTTNSLGLAQIDYPASEDFKNKTVILTVSTAFADNPTATKAMKKLDVESSVDGNYIYIEDIDSVFASAKIEAGEFMAGAVSQDSKARKTETAHKAETGEYEILLAPVTNAQFAAFLHASRSEIRPEYFDNENYNQPEQPVIGISASDAESYAAWLSSQTGANYRLPTEEEWEKAARAGNEIIYPWGDAAPNKEKNANYKGNGKYKFTSPVGAFENGKNALGISDMAGNVWEWTATSRSNEENSTFRTVKGGSWMDGPADLRISNFKDVDGTKGYPDVGFRLVKESK